VPPEPARNTARVWTRLDVVETDATDIGIAAPMTIEALRDPLDDTDRQIVGPDVGTNHSDLFADHADTPHVRCE
jgi:hypothetical protein